VSQASSDLLVLCEMRVVRVEILDRADGVSHLLQDADTTRLREQIEVFGLFLEGVDEFFPVESRVLTLRHDLWVVVFLGTSLHVCVLDFCRRAVELSLQGDKKSRAGFMKVGREAHVAVVVAREVGEERAECPIVWRALLGNVLADLATVCKYAANRGATVDLGSEGVAAEVSSQRGVIREVNSRLTYGMDRSFLCHSLQVSHRA
jgi:hypothetical protein